MDEKLEFFKALDISDNISTIIDDKIIGIHLDNDMSQNRYGQIMLVTAVNLLSRIYTKIILSIPNNTVSIQFNNEIVQLSSYIQNIALNAREGNTNTIIVSNDLSECTAVLSIGKTEEISIEVPIIYISANGWLAGISRTYQYIGDLKDKNPCGSVASACLGVAEIIKLTLMDKLLYKIKMIDGSLVFSTLDFKNNSPLPANPRIDNLFIDSVVLFGVGSVGSSMLYTMSFIHEVCGSLHIVDTDKEVESRNLLRYGYLTVSDIINFKGKDKVTWAKAKLAKDCPDLIVDTFAMSVKDYTNQLEPYRQTNLAISAVDNILARRDITDLLAKRTINAGTGDVRFTITRHGFDNGQACLYCTYFDIDHPPANNYQQYSQITKLPITRIYKLFEDNEVLNENDFEIMLKNAIVHPEMRASIIDKPLLSFIHDRFYGQVQIEQTSGTKVITLAFVTVMSGCLLFAEMIKEIIGISSIWDGTLYEQDMLMIPNEMTQLKSPNSNGLCLCQNAYRRMVYRKKYNIE